MTESSDAGASMASKIGKLRLASDIDINDHIDLSGKPCRVYFDFPHLISVSLLLTIYIYMIPNLDLVYMYLILDSVAWIRNQIVLG